MPKYLIQASLTPKGIQGLLKDGGTRRRRDAEELMESVGGQLEAFYYAFGDTDLCIIADLPDDETVVALVLVIDGSGTSNTKTTVLVTPETVDGAVQKTVNYRTPGS